MTRPENDESVIEQARVWLLRSRRWAQRGLDQLANAEEALTDRESVADFADALQAIVDVTEPTHVRGIGNTAQLLALIDLVELLLRKGNLRHLN
jgi:hypothetical protein